MRAGFDKASDANAARRLSIAVLRSPIMSGSRSSTIFSDCVTDDWMAEFPAFLNQLEGLPDQPPLHRRIVGMR